MVLSVKRVIAGIIERGGRVLVAQRPLEKRYGGLWEFPGGKVEGAETDLDALRRELEEELGLQVTHVFPPVAEYQDGSSAFVIVFVPAVTKGEPQCREHIAIRWVGWADLATLPLAPTDRRFVAERQQAG